MASGRINLQANDGKVAGVVFEDGASSNVTVTVPKEGGVVATEAYADTKVSKTGDETIAGVKTFSNTIIGNISGTSTKLNNSATDWSASGVIGNVVGMLAWKHYGNNHVIFDASNGTSPAGTAVNNTNTQIVWSPAYPTLMGWDGVQTYGVRVDSARVADAFSTAVGSAPSYACRAWVNFNGTGTVAIRASGNVSSITDNGTGDYTVNFTSAMVDANYSTQLYAYDAGADNILMSRLGYAPSVSGIRLCIYNTGSSLSDLPYINVTINR